MQDQNMVCKKIAMALVKLKTPVAFGHEEYDPVDVLVIFISNRPNSAYWSIS